MTKNKHLFSPLAMLVMCMLVSPSAWGDYQDCENAYDRGDYATALKECILLAEQGDARAQNSLGLMYRNGLGVRQDDGEAVKWYRKAAEQGHDVAQNNLGVRYQRGEGVRQDDGEAVKWYQKAAEQGYDVAQFNLGYMYELGKGVPKNYGEAVKWYRKAAEQGYARAQNSLGLRYEMRQDDGEAVKWYQKAAEQGYARAQFNLGDMYEEGKGVPRDYIVAYMWYNLAGAQGYERAINRHNDLSKKMPQAQIAEAQRRASAWKPKREQPISKPQQTPALPPILSIEEITFSEGVLDAEETATLKIRIKNVGPGDARDLRVELSGPPGLSFPASTAVPTIAKGGGEQMVAIRIRGEHALSEGTASLAIQVTEPHFKQKVQGKRMRFQTRAFRAPQLVLADAAVVEKQSGSPNNRIDVNEMIELKFYVQNRGIGAAEDVSVKVENNQTGVRWLGTGGQFVEAHPKFSTIDAGKYELVTYMYLVNSQFTASELQFKISTTERHGKYGFAETKTATINTELQPLGTLADLPRGDDVPAVRPQIEDLPDLEIDVRKDVPETGMQNPHAVAVVIGNRNYNQRDVPAVDFAVEDARIVRQYLIQTLGYDEGNILYYENATKGDFETAFGNEQNHKGKLFNYADPEGQSDIFIYYSGHGAPDTRSSSDEKPSYLVPIDADPSNVGFGGYALDLLYANLGQIPHRHVTVVIDACFSGVSEGGSLMGAISPLGMPSLAISRARFPERSAIFTASGSQEVASWYRDKRHSLFTYFFLKALRGDANVDGDQELTAAEISSYVKREVLRTARRYNNRDQNPQFSGNENAVMVRY